MSGPLAHAEGHVTATVELQVETKARPDENAFRHFYQTLNDYRTRLTRGPNEFNLKSQGKTTLNAKQSLQ